MCKVGATQRGVQDLPLTPFPFHLVVYKTQCAVCTFHRIYPLHLFHSTQLCALCSVQCAHFRPWTMCIEHRMAGAQGAMQGLRSEACLTFCTVQCAICTCSVKFTAMCEPMLSSTCATATLCSVQLHLLTCVQYLPFLHLLDWLYIQCLGYVGTQVL